MFRTGASWSGLRYDNAVAVTETLRTVLDAGGASRRLDELSTARVILKIAEQVHAAQQKAGAGKAIGPLTPASVSIETATGAVKLGLAEPTAFAYAAPEQINGGEGDRRSDVWALGVVMWEALTHETLFEGGDDAAIKAAVQQQTIDPPATLNANIPAELSAICMRALARNPADRYQSAKVMGAELEAVLDDAGYGDSDDKLREYMATLGQPPREKRLSAPPDMLTPPPGPPSSTAPGVVIPRGDAAPAPKTAHPITVPARAVGTTPPATAPIEKPAEKSDRTSRPSILDQEPAKPPASMVATSAGSLDTKVEGLSPSSFLTSPAPSAGANLAAALASAGTQAPPAAAAKPAPERVGFQTIQSAAAPMPAQSPAYVAPATIPMAPVLPKVTSSGTAQGFSSAAEAPAHEAPPVTAVEIQKPVDVAHVPSLVASAAAANAAASGSLPAAASSPAAANAVGAATIPAKPGAKRDPTPAPRTRAPTNPPDPAAVVSLPKAGRESAEVLGGWGWGTDSHPAIKPYDPEEDEIHHPGTNKRLLFYVFGGGFAVVAIILIVVFAFGSSKKADDDKLAAKTGSGSGSAEIAYGSGVEYGKATGDPTGGSAIASGAGSDLGSGSAEAMVGSAGSAVADTGSAMIATPGSDVGSNTVAANPPPVVIDAAIANTPPPDAAPVAVKKPEPVKPKEPAKPKQPEPSWAKQPVAVAPHHTDKRVEPKRPDKHVDRPASHIADPFATQHPPENPPPKVDAEAAYRQGVQQFARGDTGAALQQMRASIASNPEYAPAWRGLGLVFEKMGEKDQARSAYKRYLKLAPSANDADQIRNRMERLGS